MRQSVVSMKLSEFGIVSLFSECPLNCKSCQVTDNSATVATCTACNDYHRLIAAAENGVTVAGKCYSMYACYSFVVWRCSVLHFFFFSFLFPSNVILFVEKLKIPPKCVVHFSASTQSELLKITRSCQESQQKVRLKNTNNCSIAVLKHIRELLNFMEVQRSKTSRL